MLLWQAEFFAGVVRGFHHESDEWTDETNYLVAIRFIC